MGALAVVTAPHAAIVFAFAARPAYDDGTVADWMRYLLEHNQITPQTMSVGMIGVHAALLGEATQSSELGPMSVRFVFSRMANGCLVLHSARRKCSPAR